MRVVRFERKVENSLVDLPVIKIEPGTIRPQADALNHCTTTALTSFTRSQCDRLLAILALDSDPDHGPVSATSATADGLAPEGASQTKKFCLQVIKKRPRKPDVADVHEWCSAATAP
ncbi:hypothetical protein EVAR_23219_1 [Eumeta japonica]|uniref:Uncharacterized protein n=1 Tax=Eumeta variegata TaxID=151549 RepID=A0A4C1VF77_EUMVA|nr:hypothetical protein EVAR_23219_1 [Eumeta japonica]